MNTQRFPGLALGALVFLSAGYSLWNLSAFLHDDTMISLRYARNLVTHGELVWNVGERVEGYTNFLHILLTSGPIAAGVDPVVAARGVNFLGLGLMVLSLWQAMRFLGLSLPLRALGLAAACSVPPIAWAWGGLEAPLVAGLVALALYLVMRAAHATPGLGFALGASVVFGLGYLARPDVVVGLIAACLGLLLFAGGTWRRRLALALALALPAVAMAALHVGWRLVYYGEVMPMTFYAKVGIGEAQRLINGRSYLLHASLAYPVPALAGILGLVTVALHRRIRAETGVTLLMLALPAAYIVWSGGDHMPYARLLVPLFPVAALLLALSVQSIGARLSGGMTGGMATLGVLLLTLASVTTPGARPDEAALEGLLAGTHVRDTKPAGLLIASPTAGGLPYVAFGQRFIDTLGLNDPVIARRTPVPIRSPIQLIPGHGKGDGAYVLARKPDIILLGPGKGRPRTDAGNWFLTGIELVESPEFLRCYEEIAETMSLPSDLRALVPGSGELQFIYNRRVCDD